MNWGNKKTWKTGLDRPANRLRVSEGQSGVNYFTQAGSNPVAPVIHLLFFPDQRTLLLKTPLSELRRVANIEQLQK